MRDIVTKTEYRCCRCRSEFSTEEVESMSACPKCSCARPPQRMSEDVSVTLNWADWRALMAFAGNWVGRLEDAEARHFFKAMEKRISDLRPEGAPALTVQGQIEELQAEGFDVELRVDGEIVVPRRAAN